MYVEMSVYVFACVIAYVHVSICTFTYVYIDVCMNVRADGGLGGWQTHVSREPLQVRIHYPFSFSPADLITLFSIEKREQIKIKVVSKIVVRLSILIPRCLCVCV